LLKPTPRQHPDEWGAQNRTYSQTSGRPGRRDPWLTPYTIPFERAVASGVHPRVVLAMFSQGGKTEALLDIIGERLDNSPVPILYTGPGLTFVREQFQPRVVDLLAEAPSLGIKVGRRNTKTRMVIAGVPLRLAHAGSSAALKSDPFGLALTDEADELLASVRKQGDPIGLIDRRGESYADFVQAIVSTPSEGAIEVERDEETGLEFWAEADPEDISSKIWNLWQSGTRYHWAWRCPHCREWFIPRFSCLVPGFDAEGRPREWQKVTAVQAKAEAVLVCPQNGCRIQDDPEGENLKATMNAEGVYVAPGQRITRAGKVLGEPPEATTVSFWVSGLASPFSSWGDRAAEYVNALLSGDSEDARVVMNGGFGELFTPGSGDLPEWEGVRAHVMPYREWEVPAGVQAVTMGVDVQRNRLYYVVRGWGADMQSWLLSAGELLGDTAEDEVWSDLLDLIEHPPGPFDIDRVFIDAGFRPGKKELVPEHMVYEFCRAHSRRCYATKGFLTRPTPFSLNRIDVNVRGRKAKVGLELVRLSTDFMKTWVHERVAMQPGSRNGWHLYTGITEDYCRQIVSEARVRKPGGGFMWLEKSRSNHFLDCEALSFAAAYMLRTRIDKRARRAARAAGETPPRPVVDDEAPAERARRPVRRDPPAAPVAAAPQPSPPPPPLPAARAAPAPVQARRRTAVSSYV
jgi:phage terminase large subunit GpA-like protein